MTYQKTIFLAKEDVDTMIRKWGKETFPAGKAEARCEFTMTDFEICIDQLDEVDRDAYEKLYEEYDTAGFGAEFPDLEWSNMVILSPGVSPNIVEACVAKETCLEITGSLFTRDGLVFFYKEDDSLPAMVLSIMDHAIDYRAEEAEWESDPKTKESMEEDTIEWKKVRAQFANGGTTLISSSYSDGKMLQKLFELIDHRNRTERDVYTAWDKINSLVNETYGIDLSDALNTWEAQQNPEKQPLTNLVS